MAAGGGARLGLGFGAARASVGWGGSGGASYKGRLGGVLVGHDPVRSVTYFLKYFNAQKNEEKKY